MEATAKITKKIRVKKFTLNCLSAIAMVASGYASAFDGVTTTLTVNGGGYFAVAGTALNTLVSALADDTYTAVVTITDSSGVIKYQGNGTYTKATGAAVTKAVAVSTVGGTAWSSGMSVATSLQTICPSYTVGGAANTSDATGGAYIGVMGPTGLLRFNKLATVSNGPSPTGCGDQVLDKGANQLLFAYVNGSGNVVMSTAYVVSNTDTNVATTSVRGNLSWDTTADLDLKITSPTAVGAPSFTAGSTSVTMTAHGLAVNDMLYFTNSGGALPTGITSGTVYHVASVVDINNITIAATRGGSAITPYATGTTAPTGTHALVGYKAANTISKTLLGTAGTTYAWMDTTNTAGYGPEHFTTKASASLTTSSKYLVTAYANTLPGNTNATFWVYQGGGDSLQDPAMRSTLFTSAGQEYKFGFIVTDASGNATYSKINSF